MQVISLYRETVNCSSELSIIINLNSDKKRWWDSQLESLKDGKMCDSEPILADEVGNLISKEFVEWYDEKYEPESDL
jgi:hypothetical protein